MTYKLDVQLFILCLIAAIEPSIFKLFVCHLPCDIKHTKSVLDGSTVGSNVQNENLNQGFFKKNVRNPVWISRDPIFSDFRDPMIIFSDSRDPNRVP